MNFILYKKDMKVVVCKDYDEMSKKAANIVKSGIILKNNIVLGLATGSTPIGLYQNLIKAYNNSEITFKDVHTINLDEYVGINFHHPQSYHYFMNENLFKHIDIKKDNINIPDGLSTDLNRSCRIYDEIIESFGSIDIQILGIGQNGHIGFNEPANTFSNGTHIVDLTINTREANKRFFNSIDEVPMRAITMGTKHILQSKIVILMANGKNKAQAIKDTVKGPINPMVPASILQYHKECYVFVDEEAAFLL